MMTKGITALGLDRDLGFSRGKRKERKEQKVVRWGRHFFVREIQQIEVPMGSMIFFTFFCIFSP